MRHFQKLADGIDVIPLLNALAQRPELWNENTLRTTHPASPHQQTDDIWCRFQALDDPDMVNSTSVVPYRAWLELPVAGLVLDLMRRVGGTELGRVIITRLAPGKTIAAHTDGGTPATFYSRYHIALKSEPGALNSSGGEVVNYRMGEAWWFDNRIEHEITNNSADDRIVIIVDVRAE